VIQFGAPHQAVARYLAAHSPTERAVLQTADIVRRTAGLTTHRSPESYFVTIRPRSLTLSKRRSAQAPLLPISVAPSLMLQRSGWRASVTQMSTPIGRRRTTCLGTPTPCRNEDVPALMSVAPHGVVAAPPLSAWAGERPLADS
jgi:hypothetical protein